MVCRGSKTRIFVVQDWQPYTVMASSSGNLLENVLKNMCKNRGLPTATTALKNPPPPGNLGCSRAKHEISHGFGYKKMHTKLKNLVCWKPVALRGGVARGHPNLTSSSYIPSLMLILILTSSCSERSLQRYGFYCVF